MATLLNTLLAALFPLLFAPEHEEVPMATEMESTGEVTVYHEETNHNGFQVYFYPQSDSSCRS